MSASLQRRIYDADDVDAFTGPLEARLEVLRAQLDSAHREAGPVTLGNEMCSSEPFLVRVQQLARLSAEETVHAARQEAGAVLARAHAEARDRVADAQIRAALLVSAVHGRIDSLAVGWEHQLLKQINETRQSVLTGLDRYAEQLRSSPDDWPRVAEPDWPVATGGSATAEDPVPTEAPVVIDGIDKGQPSLSEPPTSSATWQDVGITGERHRSNRLRPWKWLGLSRSRASRGERATTSDDPFFNPDLRWQDNCGDEEFLSFLRNGDHTSPVELPVATPSGRRVTHRARAPRSS